MGGRGFVLAWIVAVLGVWLALDVPAAYSQTSPTGALEAVSCISAGNCMAVGTISELEVNGRWSLAPPIAVPAGLSLPVLSGLSCTPRFSPGVHSGHGGRVVPCVAVGEAQNAAGDQLPLAEIWDGRRWSVASAGLPRSGSYLTGLNGVSCLSASDCFAVGQLYPGRDYEPIIVRWNGASWSKQSFFIPEATAGGLYALTCLSASDCWAVGWEYPDTRYALGGVALALRWDGRAWRYQPLPFIESYFPPSEAESALAGIACPRVRSCTAVGGWSPDTITAGTLAEQWNGSAWKVLFPPSRGDDYNGLSTVACSSLAHCTAVGAYGSSGGQAAVVTERWNGTRWGAQAGLTPDQAELNGVACPTDDECVAVGLSADQIYVGEYPSGYALVESWNGSRWSLSGAT